VHLPISETLLREVFEHFSAMLHRDMTDLTLEKIGPWNRLDDEVSTAEPEAAAIVTLKKDFSGPDPLNPVEVIRAHLETFATSHESSQSRDRYHLLSRESSIFSTKA
jgi:hypothetical protein